MSLHTGKCQRHGVHSSVSNEVALKIVDLLVIIIDFVMLSADFKVKNIHPLKKG